MHKNEYIAGNGVKAFVAWMSVHLDDATFAHAYTLRQGNVPWDCTSLFNAYERYEWRHDALPGYGLPSGSTFASNLRVLEKLQSELREGLEAGSNERVFEAAKAVMIWGGVTHCNVQWLESRRGELCRIIGAIRDAINAGDMRHPVFSDAALRFTSGMSKVYALVCDDFAIYDSRVAAALGRAVVLFCRDTGRETVPDGLDFAWAMARGMQLRHAAQDQYTFRRLTAGRVYASWNLKASWVLSAVASRLNIGDRGFGGLREGTRRLRALEAAFFMFGYDLVVPVGGDPPASIRQGTARDATRQP
jgi:hypothetical protein